MAADLIFFCIHINWPRFRVIIILNSLHDNEVIRANLYAYKRILNRRPFMNKVYSLATWLVNLFLTFSGQNRPLYYFILSNARLCYSSSESLWVGKG